MPIKFVISLLVTLFFISNNVASKNIDSLVNCYQRIPQADTLKVQMGSELVRELFSCNQLEEGLLYAKELLYVSESTQNLKGQADALYGMGWYELKKTKYNEGIRYLTRAVELCSSLNDQEALGKCYKLLGNAYSVTDDYMKAIDYYQNSLKIQELHDTVGIPSTYNGLGTVYGKLGQNKKAITFYEKAYESGKGIGNRGLMSRIFNNMGIAYVKIGDTISGLEYYDKALLIKEENNDLRGTVAILNNTGNIYANQGVYDTAYLYHKRALRIAQEIDNKKSICYSNYCLGTLFLNKKEYNSALYYTNKSKRLAQELGLANMISNIYGQLSKINEGMNNFSEAYYNLLLYKTLHDSIFNENNIKELTQIELQYTYEKEKELLKQEQQSEIAIVEKEIVHHKKIRNYFIYGFIFAAITILLLLYTVGIIRRKNVLLKNNNEKIKQQKLLINSKNKELQYKTMQLSKHKDNLEQKVIARTCELEVSKKKAEDNNRLKAAFLNNISHEFRTPMNGIMGFSRLLTKPELSENQREQYKSFLHSSCFQLLNLVTDTVEISEIHAETAMLGKSNVKLFDMINEIVDQFKATIVEKDIQVKVELNSKLVRSFFEIDQYKVKRVFEHLLNNALKFSYDGTITLHGKYQEDMLRFQIEDKGIGISFDMQQKVLEPFIQGNHKGGKKYDGTGIGLSLSKGYVEMMGGKLWLSSKLGMGTTIFFDIPAEVTGEDSQFTNTNPTKDLAGKTILIAEDNGLNYSLIKAILKGYDVNLLHAWNGKQAVDIVKTHETTIHLALLDLKMPIMDGFEALQNIKRIKSDLPIIAQTAFLMKTDEIEMHMAGFVDCIFKPIDSDELITKIKNCIL